MSFNINPKIDSFMQAAIAEAKQGLFEGGIPIGSSVPIMLNC